MYRKLLAGAIVGLVAGCAAQKDDLGAVKVQAAASGPAAAAAAASARESIADAPDRGSLLSFGTGQPRRHGGSTWYPIRLSEEHALHAIQAGGMVLPTPGGHPIALEYRNSVVHDDGSWSWVGHVKGAPQGADAILTFGRKAVFASIPNGTGEPLEITTSGGQAWLVQSNGMQASAALSDADAADFLAPPPSLVAAAAKVKQASAPRTLVAGASASVKTQAIAPALTTTVDVVVGYTTGFATRLGGQSQALTRLNFIFDVANQTYDNSQVGAHIRLAHAIEVNYADATENRAALFDLSGVQCTLASGSGQMHLPDIEANCTPKTPSSSLQPLLAARAQYGGDLVTLVRTFQYPENQSCGVAWVLGGGQTTLDASDASFGFSVISDSSGNAFPDSGNTCSDITLVHELGHNMGLVHDASTAAGSDDTNGDSNLLDPEEYGRFADSFGYRADATSGNFYTVMAIRSGSQTGYRVFANPRITFCGGHACGQVGVADQAATLNKTMPIIAGFRPSLALSAGNWLQGDYDGDGRSDIIWRNPSTGAETYWKAGNSATRQSMASVTDPAWIISGLGDFNGDGKSDVLWRNNSTGANIYWKSANAETRQSMSYISDLNWKVGGVGDFNNDGSDDILWRNTVTGVNTIWRSASAATRQSVATLAPAWVVAGVGDFDGDHKADIFWRNPDTGANMIWRAGNSTLKTSSSTPAAWVVAGVGDFSGDGKDDILWRNMTTGANILWLSGDINNRRTAASLADMAWCIVGVGDFDRDGKADILWRNNATGANMIWRAANGSNVQAVTALNVAWIVGG